MIRGVVLCGGESKRMGHDKGLLPMVNKTWAQHAVDKLQSLNIPVLVSINKTQAPNYHCFFRPEQLVIDQVAAKGPLTGLLSTHLNYPDDNLLLLACDMTEMDEGTLQALKSSTIIFPGFDYYLFAQGDFMEPLCAIYTSGILKKLCHNLHNKGLSNFSLRKLIKQGNYKVLSIIETKSFSNHNTATNKFHI
jgi:molybdopterin-guanine dinucleotide biosynthesis protein A